MSFVQKILIGSLHTGQNIWPDWFTFHQSRYYVSMAYRPVNEETCDVNIKIAQTTQSIWILWSESQGYWRKGNLWQLSRRYGPKTGVSLPPLGCIVTKVLWKIAQTVTYTVQSDFFLRCFRYSWHLMIKMHWLLHQYVEMGLFISSEGVLYWAYLVSLVL